MPFSAARSCSEPGCPELVTRPGVSRCPAHHVEYQRRLRQARPTPTQRGYGRAWQRYSRAWLRQHPTCARCGKPATDVHHIDGVGVSLRVVSLCHSCHARVTGHEHPH